jgi:hypothetical protein
VRQPSFRLALLQSLRHHAVAPCRLLSSEERRMRLLRPGSRYRAALLRLNWLLAMSRCTIALHAT